MASLRKSRQEDYSENGNGRSVSPQQSKKFLNTSATHQPIVTTTTAPIPTANGSTKEENSIGFSVSDYDKSKKKMIGLYETRPSLLSSENTENVSYRGVLNLAIILLVFANARTVVVNLLQYGWRPSIDHLLISDYVRWPGVITFLSLNFFIWIAYALELAALKKTPEKRIEIYQSINIAASVILPTALVWTTRPNPASGVTVMCATCCLMMKLISYARVNSQLRAMYKKSKHDNTDPNAYPNNLKLFNLYWFLFLPFLVYQLEYPRTDRIRWLYLGRRVFEMAFLSTLIYILIQQYIIPVLGDSLTAIDNFDVLAFSAAILRLCLPHMYVWLLFFYVFFHLYLNILAEVMRVGDRCYYKDWWNSTGLDYFWQTWNVPVHNWIQVHVYTPLRKNGWSREFSIFMAFFISGIFHELVISVPFHTVKLWAFFGLLSQLPLIYFTRKLMHGQNGNIVFWVCFILGQPTITLFYHYAVVREKLSP
eukprot:TRINITY_DN1145_c0_g1_i1.p1 TRINITY_DN1145_c0_g1~~TRINITY_DN1145_c0_g1_i1.p1  ORF type:complete len:481 (-),score=65.60 TRINITY_DN1145_c0_g1_i1:138-1580(-)